MLKKEYYCLVSGLPDLIFNENKPAENSMAFIQELKVQLTPNDYKHIECLRYAFDNENLLNLFFNHDKEFIPLGNISKEVMESQLHPTTEDLVLPEYMLHFIHWMKESESKDYSVAAENLLQSLYYEFTLKSDNPFLVNWLRFDWSCKNVFTTFHCCRYGYDLAEQLITYGEDSELNSLLSKRRLQNPDLFEDLLPYNDEIFKVPDSKMELIEKEKVMDRIRWKYLDENTFFHYFSIEKILSYLIKLLIVERWTALDQDKGINLLNELVSEIKTSYEFPMEFSL